MLAVRRNGQVSHDVGERPDAANEFAGSCVDKDRYLVRSAGHDLAAIRTEVDSKRFAKEIFVLGDELSGRRVINAEDTVRAGDRNAGIIAGECDGAGASWRRLQSVEGTATGPLKDLHGVRHCGKS